MCTPISMQGPPPLCSFRINPSAVEFAQAVAEGQPSVQVEKDILRQVKRLESEMLAAAKELEFERAAELRDAITYLKQRDLGVAP